VNKYVALTEFEEMLNKKKAAVEEDAKPIRETGRPQPNRLRHHQVVVGSCCILLAFVAGGALLRVEGEIGAVRSAAEAAVKDIGTLKARMAIDTTKERITAIKAEVDALQAAKIRLEDQVEQMKNIVETVKNRENDLRRTGKRSQAGSGK